MNIFNRKEICIYNSDTRAHLDVHSCRRPTIWFQEIIPWKQCPRHYLPLEKITPGGNARRLQKHS